MGPERLDFFLFHEVQKEIHVHIGIFFANVPCLVPVMDGAGVIDVDEFSDCAVSEETERHLADDVALVDDGVCDIGQRFV